MSQERPARGKSLTCKQIYPIQGGFGRRASRHLHVISTTFVLMKIPHRQGSIYHRAHKHMLMKPDLVNVPRKAPGVSATARTGGAEFSRNVATSRVDGLASLMRFSVNACDE